MLVYYTPVIKLIFIISIIIAGLHFRVPLGAMLVAGGLMLGILFSVGIRETIDTVVMIAADSLTWQLIGTLILVMILEKAMKDKETNQKMVEGVHNSIRNPLLALSIPPALVGLLPSPGGALFSCPLVEQVSGDMDVSAEIKSFANYWFRHVWEYSFPLYPSIVLAAGLVSIPLHKLILFMLPITIIKTMIGIGLLRLVTGGRVKTGHTTDMNWQKGVLQILKGISPILITLILMLVFRLPPVIGLLIVVTGVLVHGRYTSKEIWAMVTGLNWQLLSSVMGILFFKEMLAVSHVIDIMPQIMLNFNLPVLLISAIMPFLLGALTGLTAGMVGLSFPLIMGFTAGVMEPGLAVVAFVCGFAGIMLTPLHLCLIISVNYFNARMATVMSWVAASEALVVISALLLYLYVY
jgi:integral membrane protein (TIGR00529 family)